jgi:membrane-associated phospholipid phosphatase
VRNYADLRSDRGAEIISQLGFPTEYFAMILGLHQAQHAKTIELITATQVMAAHIAMIVKNALAIRRPDQIDGRIMPMIPTPGHGAFPSAHATEAYAVNKVLSVLSDKWGSFEDLATRHAMMRGLAERIAVNRTVAGVHFPIDSWAGAVLGTAIGEAVLGLCGVDSHDITNYEYTADNHDFSDFAFVNEAASHGVTEHNRFTISQGQNWNWLWNSALAETQNA